MTRAQQAFDLAREQGLEYHFDIKGDDASIHPNTVDIDMVDDTGATAQVRGERPWRRQDAHQPH